MVLMTKSIQARALLMRYSSKPHYHRFLLLAFLCLVIGCQLCSWTFGVGVQYNYLVS